MMLDSLIFYKHCHNAILFNIFYKIMATLAKVNYETSHIWREGNICTDWLAKRCSTLLNCEYINNISSFRLFNWMLRLDNRSGHALYQILNSLPIFFLIVLTSQQFSACSLHVKCHKFSLCDFLLFLSRACFCLFFS
ncbi:hypothetical protein KFK09_008842 [Dendrobium nobile]|uniref:Uncharacterized protein n=1 Tax=Dendrobium nobile TaxID=94219 RepID=A0A8T3BR30_DENNO|nr:hypothetical protein KFK09_008842 [Dendrobium nobile]